MAPSEQPRLPGNPWRLAQVPTAELDTFAQDNLPPRAQWPDLLVTEAGLHYPDRLNCVTELLDIWNTRGLGARPAMGTPDETWSYAGLTERVNRIANVLTRRLGLTPGNRVLLRAPNTPMLVATMLAVIKAGGIAVPTMPLLRTRELRFVIDKARVRLALCDHRLLDELARAGMERIIPIGGTGESLETLMAGEPDEFEASPTRAEDVCLIAFTSGTTGVPKGTMHFHRDLLAVCDTYGRHVLRATPDDVFTGSPPIAFTFGLGAVVLFPLRIGASTILLEQASPERLLALIRTGRPTVCFTAPPAYRAMLTMMQPGDAARLRLCVSAGEALPKATWDAWRDATGVGILDGIGSTEMLHIFIGAPAEKIRPGATGLPVPGYQAKLIDDDGRDLPPGATGRLAVRGPTGCRYLADPRQQSYVQDGWNITGDSYRQDADGYFWFQARSDDMIIASGYNIAGPEVEAALVAHPAVAECAVVGVPDQERGTIVKAYVVLRPGHAASEETARALQEHVKAEIAPYKYPRAIAFLDSLPRTEFRQSEAVRAARNGDGGRGAQARMNWGTMSRAERDAAYNNSAAVPGSPALNAHREQRSAAFRAAHPDRLDLAYGPRERNRWDLFPARDPGAPCLVFIHGGYWQSRTREEFASLIEGPHALGWSCALPGYTLAPDASLTEIVAEISAALDWLAAQGPAHGIAGPVVLSGWSAGGHLTAMALGHPLVRAGLAISGLFELGPIRDTYLNERLRLSDDEIAAASPLRLPVVPKPLAIAYGSAELPPLVADSRDLHARRAAAHAPGPLLAVPGADHFTVVLELQSATGALTRQLPLLLD